MLHTYPPVRILHSRDNYHLPFAECQFLSVLHFTVHQGFHPLLLWLQLWHMVINQDNKSEVRCSWGIWVLLYKYFSKLYCNQWGTDQHRLPWLWHWSCGWRRYRRVSDGGVVQILHAPWDVGGGHRGLPHPPITGRPSIRCGLLRAEI